MKRALIIGLGLALAACATPTAQEPILEPFGFSPVIGDRLGDFMFSPGCPPAGWDRAKLDALKASGFEIADAGEREEFAKAITGCLGSHDPVLRDGIAFEALTHMLREKQLSDATKKALVADLVAQAW